MDSSAVLASYRDGTDCELLASRVAVAANLLRVAEEFAGMPRVMVRVL